MLVEENKQDNQETLLTPKGNGPVYFMLGERLKVNGVRT